MSNRTITWAAVVACFIAARQAPAQTNSNARGDAYAAGHPRNSSPFALHQDEGGSGQPPRQSAEEADISTEAQTSESTTTETYDSGGFWIFDEPAPLTGRIVTDRPGFSDSAALVPRGRFQLEGGYTFTYDREHDRRVYDHQFPEMLFRTGLTDCLEFRVGWTGASLTETLDRITTPAGRRIAKKDHDDGWRDMSLGLKVPLLRDCDKLPNVSMIYTMGVPTGNPSKSTDDVSYELKFPWNYAINDCFTIYGSVLGRIINSPDGHFFQSAATLAGGYRISDNVLLYCEYFGVYHAGKDTDCLHVLSAGPIIHLADNVSLDMRAGVGLNEEAPDFQASIGLGFRF